MKGIVIKMGKVVVSACLLGRNCKYSGGNNYSEKLHKWLEGKEVIEVCPEVAGGLPTPRTPVELVNGWQQTGMESAGIQSFIGAVV